MNDRPLIEDLRLDRQHLHRMIGAVEDARLRMTLRGWAERMGRASDDLGAVPGIVVL